MPCWMAIKRSTLVVRKYSKMREMKKLVVSVIIIGILLWTCSDGCLDYERNALMELMDSYDFLPRSMDGEDCCQWDTDTVVCNSSTGQIIQLHIFSDDEYRPENYYFNASLFLPFHQLNTLIIDGDVGIVGCVPDQCFKKLLGLEKLESLTLGENKFKNRSILSSIASISSLRFLDLSGIGFEGMDEIQWLSNLEKLEKLDLSWNNFKDTKLLSLPVISSLKTLFLRHCGLEGTVDIQGLEKLEYLDLSGNTFNNTTKLLSLPVISSLKTLSLMECGLEGTVDIQGLSKLEKLEHLDLSWNSFTDTKLLSLPALSSLKTLYLEDCGLKGTIDIEALTGNGTSLKDLSLAGNEIESFGGGADFKSFGNLELLDLSDNYLDNSILSSLNHCFSLKYLYIVNNKLQGLINLEELDALANLEELSLSENQIDRIVGSRGVNVSRNLRALYLYHITLGERRNVELHSLGAYPHLKTIFLTKNQFEGPIFAEEGNLTNVEELYLDRSSLDKESFQSLSALLSLKYLSLQEVNAIQPAQGFSNLTNLEYLDMTSCTVESTFLRDIGRIVPLKTLKLANSGLNGTIPDTEGLCKLIHLEELDISYNELGGTLPWCIANLTSLKSLNLSSNHFNGSISPLRSLASLQDLRFSDNQFQVPISLEPFFNHSKLKYLDAQNNSQIYNDEEIDVHSFIPKFQLETLLISSPGNVGAFPKFLYHQNDLQKVDLSNIKLKGEFPYWLLVNNTKLSSLSLANTSLSGPFQLQNDSSEYLLEHLDISDNKFNGTIPTNIGQVLPNLQYLNLSENRFTGSIPSSFGKMSSLADLDMSYNWLSGEVPEDLYLRCSLLYQVIISHNDFEGQILPKQVNYLNRLVYLLLDGNQFTRNIPNSLLNCTNLSILDVHNNHLSGNLPEWIANMSSLQVLDLSNNSFSKTLPSHFCPHDIKEVYLSNNQLQGSLENVFDSCSELIILDLSHNHLTGTISKWIGNLTNLSYILLSFNQLQGALPIELCNLGQLCMVDLSNNNLSSSILSCLKLSSRYMQSEVINVGTGYSSSVVPNMQRPLDFTTKGITYEFRGSVLKLISGIDFSCNNFTGEIPGEIGNLSNIKALNLSHNSLTGPIPQSFVNLTQIESLDLSYNNLNGKIPRQLTQLHFVSKFSVAHNNLSGKTPEMVGQFATFDKSSYEGNPFLCGLPLLESCQAEDSPTNSIEEDEESGFIHMNDFYVSFLISYVIVLLSIAAVLYINPYWRRAWFYFIEVSLRNCYYFMEDIIIALRKLGAS